MILRIILFDRIVSQGFTQPNLEEVKRIIDNAAVDNVAKEFLTVDNKKCTYILVWDTICLLSGGSDLSIKRL